MFTPLISAFALLRNNPVVIIVGIALVIAGLALLWQTATVYNLRLKLAQKENAIVQLQGAIELQNAQVLDWKRQSDDTTKLAQGTLRAARAGAEKDEARYTALLNRKSPRPELACAAADALILEFAK